MGKQRGRRNGVKNTRKRPPPNNNNKKKKRAGKPSKDEPSTSRKHLFNRYKDKETVERKLLEKKKIEERMEVERESSESEEEANPMERLLSTFETEKKNGIRDESDSSEDEDEKAILDEEGDSEAEDSSSENEADDEMPEEPRSEDAKKEEEPGEEEEECEIDQETEKEEKSSSSDDNFTIHFKNELHDSLLKSVSTNSPINSHCLNWPIVGQINATLPVSDQEASDKPVKVSLLEDKVFAAPGKLPERMTDVNWEKNHVKKQIRDNILGANRINLCRKECNESLTDLQKEMFSVINNYQDFYYAERSFTNAEEIRLVYCLHAMNHILKTRTKILHHNARLTKKDAEVSDEFRDQGLVRPKVLILAPFKDSAYRIIKLLIALLAPDDPTKVINKNRFEEDFTGSELSMPKRNPKPEDYELTFVGNTDDTFRIGLSVTKKSLKLYSDFYSSDIIVASPLGLRIIVGADGEEGDFDFLASIELLILDQCEIFLMQNWDHLLHILDHLHLQPKKPHGTDFSRLRLWAVNGWTKYYRQTLIFSSIFVPEIYSVFNKRCFNYAGKLHVHNRIQIGSIRQVTLPVPQVFRRIEAKDPIDAIEARFECFVNEILPQYKDNIMAHTMIYVPCYFDYVRIRNHFKKEETSFVQICEYSKDAKIARARDMFFHTEAHYLLYSERFHFFRRMRIKGIRHVIFYQPPTFSHFYSEMCNLMQEANQNKYGGSESNMSIMVMYTKYDLQRVTAIVGYDRTAKMHQADKNTCMFMTGD